MQAVWSAINETAQIHKTVAIQNDLQALRKDLDSDRQDLQTMQGELLSVRKNVEDVVTKHSELEKKINTIAKHQNMIDKVSIISKRLNSKTVGLYLYLITYKLYYIHYIILEIFNFHHHKCNLKSKKIKIFVC